MVDDRTLAFYADPSNCGQQQYICEMAKELIARRKSHIDIDEIVAEWGTPQLFKTEDGEAWYWAFKEDQLPVADTLSELLRAAKDVPKL